jgi:hypothetical protein
MVTFTDASVSDVSVTVEDSNGRSASISFEPQSMTFHRSRPNQGKCAKIAYEDLLDMVLKYNPRFFDKV